MRTKNLLNGKPEGGFRSLAAVLPSFGFALAVFAAAGMVLAGCDNLAGSGNGDEAVFAEAAAPEGAGGTTALSAGGTTKTINVKFEVKNGGGGLSKTWGIVTGAGSVRGGAKFANDFTLTTTVPATDEYIFVYFKAQPVTGAKGYLFAMLDIKDAGEYTIVIDYNKSKAPSFSTKNLRNVSWSFPESEEDKDYCEWWWNALWDEAVDD